MAYDLVNFTLGDMTRCGADIRAVGEGATTMEEVANRTIRYLWDELRDPGSGDRTCALVRFYKTHPFEELGPDQRAAAAAMLDGRPPDPRMRCLTLLATVGEEVDWNSRHRSANHRAIPLASRRLVERAPMITRLITQFGLEVGDLVDPHVQLLREAEERNYNVFYVPEAVGSPYIPAQQSFVIPYQIRSVLGFGGMLPTTDLFAVILFARRAIPVASADLFRPLALNVKLAILPYSHGPVFN